tara:strand:+ start:544 stop:1158 length:615 start_codon:yes stop_codon:yes gene_type:complete
MKFDEFKIKRKIIRNIKKVPERIKIEARRKLEREKALMLKEFDSHPVTNEIEAGPDSGNSSGTLGGTGNLFSFIGFPRGTFPTEIIRFMLNDYRITNLHTPRIKRRVGVGGIDFIFRIKGPDMTDIERQTYLSWLGKSWVRGIERGLSGIGYYLYYSGVSGNEKHSRSGSAIQSRYQLRGGSFRPTAYLSAIIKTFLQKVRRVV